MNKRPPTREEIAGVEAELWNVIRALELIQRAAEEISVTTAGETNAKAEGIAGTAASISSHVRLQQIALGGQL